MNVKNIVFLLVAVGLAIGLLGFLRQQSGPKTQSLRLGTNVWPGYEPLYLARTLGEFDESSVRLVECSSASHVIREFRNDTLEVAALTLDEALILKANGYDVQVILVTDVSHGGDVILSKPEIKSLTELRGRKIGVENTALGAYVLTRALQGVDMSAGDVTAVPLEVDEHERAFDEGKVDAVVTFDPVRSRLLEKGAVKLFDSTEIPGEIVDVLVARRSTINERPEKFAALLKGWFAAVEHLHKDPGDASTKMSERLKLQPQDVLTSFEEMKLPDYKENLRMLGGSTPKLEQTAKSLVDVMVKQKLLNSDIDVSGLFSTEPLNQLRTD